VSVPLAGKTAWITGAGSGIGEAAAIRLAGEGVRVALSGRREAPLVEVAQRIRAAGGEAHVAPMDHGDPAQVERARDAVLAALGRLDILVSNAGTNIVDRHWDRLDAGKIKYLLDANLTGNFYVAAAALPQMRAQGGGLMIHTASWAGRYIGYVSGPAYTAAKHGVVAMSATINMQEGRHNIRSTCICPGEVATPILLNRPQQLTQEELDRLITADDIAEAILYVATQPPRVCVNELLISPTFNRGYLAMLPKAG
jgi:NADP-dependent 3-hydroxy acid dehydrogenase YdfG